MRSLMRRAVVVTGAAAALLGPAVGVANASGASAPGGAQSRTVSAAPGPAAAQARAAGWTVVPSPSPGTHSIGLTDVAVVSATSAWAVGFTNATLNREQALILHWNGSSWKQQSSPNTGSAYNELDGVAATSPTNAWAVGYHNNGASTPRQTLILHWNGTAWKQVPSPNPTAKGNNVLYGVAATSATDAWAVGYDNNSANPALIVHWNGTAWKQVPSPHVSNVAGGPVLRGVAATSATNAWAVGDTGSVGAFQALIERWNGTVWKQVPAAASSGTPVLFGVAATSASNAWAVGTNCGGCSGGQTPGTLIVHWNGTAWKQQSSPSPGGNSDQLERVAATSATNAWAVGFSSTALIVHWDGTAWKQQSSPNPDASVIGVAATSATNAWAVGGYLKGGTSHTLTLHCC
jgi:hypothetical protein